ncbi:MAG: alkaline phosphatase [Promethearchaeota archaeon]
MNLKKVKNGNLLGLMILSFLVLSCLSPFIIINAEENGSESTKNFGGISVILMIGDGMGHEHVKLGRWVEVGINGHLNIDQLPFRLNVTTYSADGSVTDSAAAGTALATGNKTENQLISISPTNQTFQTILEIAKTNLMKSVGVVTTDSLTGGTPATFMSHSLSRYNEAGIAKQIAEEQDIDVLLGGGKTYFNSYLETFETKGYTIVENKTELESINSGKVLGLFSFAGMPEEYARDRTLTPSLAEMTSKAIELLSQNPNGFFLMVEGAQIDWASHSNDKEYAALEMIEFDKAVAVAKQYAESSGDTLLIVTADHETGGLSVISENMTSSLPSSSNTAEENEELRLNRVGDITVQWSTTGHTNTSVPFYGYGASFEDSVNTSIIDNTEIFTLMKSYFIAGSQSVSGFMVFPLIMVIAVLIPIQVLKRKRRLQKQN